MTLKCDHDNESSHVNRTCGQNTWSGLVVCTVHVSLRCDHVMTTCDPDPWPWHLIMRIKTVKWHWHEILTHIHDTWHVTCSLFMTSDCIMWSCDVIIKYVILPCDPVKWHCHKIINNWNRWIRLSAPASSEIINLYICILYKGIITIDDAKVTCCRTID